MSAGRNDLPRQLRELVRVAPQVAIGLVDTVEAIGGGYLVSGSLQPSGDPFQARVLFGPIGASTGDLFPVSVGDEVLVLAPDGDPNRAVALWGGNSSAAALPSSFTNDKPRLVHPQGKTFATSQAAATAPVVVEALLTDLQGVVTELLALYAGLASLGVTVPSPNTTAFLTKLATLYRSKAVFSE